MAPASLPGLHCLCRGVSTQEAHGVLNHMGLDVMAALLLMLPLVSHMNWPSCVGRGGGVGLEHRGPEDHSPGTRHYVEGGRNLEGSVVVYTVPS